MPRHVDPEQRRRLVAAALWRVVLRDGLQRATVRGIAAEAGLSLGAISHYFASHDELVLHTLRLIKERESARLDAVTFDGGGRELFERLLWATMPMEPEHREHNQVHYAFLAQAVVTPALRTIVDELNTEVRDFVGRGIEMLSRAGAIAAGHDLDVLADEFHALTEGLSFQNMMWPQQVTPEVIRATCRRWLDALAPPPE